MTDDDEFTDVDELAAIRAYQSWKEAARRHHPSADMRRSEYEHLRGVDPDESP